MRILFLTQILPYPPDAGPRVKTWNVLRYLAQRGHEVHLASFVRPEEEVYLDDVRRLCASVSAVTIRRSRHADMLAWARSHLRGRPFLVERDDAGAMRKLAFGIVETRGIEAIHADQLSMAQFAMNARDTVDGRPLLVFDAHNAVWKVVERMKQQLPTLLGPVIDLEARRTKAYEGHIVREFDRTLAVSELDRAALAEATADRANGNSSAAAHDRIIVVPIGVDTNILTPVATPPESTNILTLGTLHYPPNADGVRWFAREVYPQVRATEPRATLTIVGKNPPDDVRNLANDQAIAVTGYVPDLAPYLEAAALMVVPVRAGGGMRVRILEGFARGIPMVTTTVGLEGIEAEPGRDILVADSPTDFAETVVRLLREDHLGTDLAINGRSLVVEKFDWRIALKPLDRIYSRQKAEVFSR